MIRYQYKNGTDQVKTIFSLPADGLDSDLAVVGDFNGWDPTATPMRKRSGKRTASVTLEAGKRYRFRYLQRDGQWFNDDAADAYEMGELGVDNSILDLTDAGVVGGPVGR